MTRAEWKRMREHAIDEASNQCERCGHASTSPTRFNVLRTRKGLLVLCIRCRLVGDAKERAAKARRTIAIKKLQLRLPNVPAKKRRAA